MANQPLVSVLMTAYNREKYIAEAIESVLASTYPHFELIIVDDCSQDRTVDIATSYAAKDSRIRVYKNETNLGDYANRNKAASYATGEYIKYLDSDDYIYPWGLAVLMETMQKHPQVEWGLCSATQNSSSSNPFPIVLTPDKAYAYHYLGPGLFNKPPLMAIIKRSLFLKFGGFSTSRMVSDFDMWNRLAQEHSVVVMADGFLWSREHPEQEMNDFRKFLTTYERIKIHYLTDAKCPLSREQVLQAIRKRKRGLFNQTCYFLLKFKFRHALVNMKLLHINISFKRPASWQKKTYPLPDSTPIL